MLTSVCKRKVVGVEMADYWYRLDSAESMDHPEPRGCKKEIIKGPCVVRVRRDAATGAFVEADRYEEGHVIPSK